MSIKTALQLTKFLKNKLKDVDNLHFMSGNKIDVQVRVPSWNRDSKKTLRKTISLKTKDEVGVLNAIEEAKSYIPGFKKQAYTAANGIEYTYFVFCFKRDSFS